MSKSVLNLGSMTYATKAKMILAQYAIEAKATKLSSTTTGCTNAIEFDSKNYNNVCQILLKHKIPFKELNQ